MNRDDLARKLTSRKFWVAVAAMLASIATSVAGMQSGSDAVMMIGTVCGVASAAIYAFTEAWVDAARLSGSDKAGGEQNADF